MDCHQPLCEELIESAQFLDNETYKDAAGVPNFYVPGNSVSKGYKRDEIQWPVHFRPSSVGAVNHREGANLRALLEYGIEANVSVDSPPISSVAKSVGARPPYKVVVNIRLCLLMLQRSSIMASTCPLGSTASW